MTDIGEKVSIANETDEADKCPFCGKADCDGFKERKKQVTTKVISKPKQLNCGTVSGGGEGKWTTAFHHIICAKQCYAKLKPLVRMGTMFEYDINDQKNGVGLPTLKNKYDGKIWGSEADKGTKKKYGELDDRQKQKVADYVIENTKKQWHVGHHSFERLDSWDVEESAREDGMLHENTYDNSVLQMLYEIYEAIHEFGLNLCEDPEDRTDEFKQVMDDLSQEIKSDIEKFSTSEPWKSNPFFVSKKSEVYAFNKLQERKNAR